jgi:hypothetical protein
MREQHSTDLGNKRPKRAVVVSYVPLLTGEPGQVMDADDPEFHRRLLEIDRGSDGHVDACLWMANAEGVFPTFVLKDAHAVADHLLSWAEGRPAEWFALCIAEARGRYVAGLFPNVAGSVQRFELAHLIAHRDTSNADDYEIVFRPLTFVSGLNHTLHRVEAMIPMTTMVGFVEPNQFDPQAPERFAADAIRLVGPFPVCRDSQPFGFSVSGMLEELIREAEAE